MNKTAQQFKDELIKLAFEFRDSDFECPDMCEGCPLLFSLNLCEYDEFEGTNMCDAFISIINNIKHEQA